MVIVTAEEQQAKYCLVHSGTKGMRKGVNKYRNPDGTLNEAGKARYYKLTKSYSKTESRSDKNQIKAANHNVSAAKLDRKLKRKKSKLSDIDKQKLLRKYYKERIKSLKYNEKVASGKIKLARLRKQLTELDPDATKEFLAHSDDDIMAFFELYDAMTPEQQDAVAYIIDCASEEEGVDLL